MKTLLLHFLVFVLAFGIYRCEKNPKKIRPHKNQTIDVKTKHITFGVYTSDKPSTVYKKFKPIIDYLQKQLKTKKTKLKIDIYPSYLKAIDALVRGQCDFARFGPTSYILAKKRNSHIQLLVIEHKNGKKRFNGIFIVPKNSHIKSIKELKGKTFAFGNKNSTIGRYLSQYELIKAGIYASSLKHYHYLERHDTVALAVAMGRYDAGVVKENTFKKYTKSKGLKKIGEFFNITKPWVVREGFDPKLFIVLQEALLKLKDKKVLKELKQSGFLKAKDEEYDFVRKSMLRSREFERK